VGNVFGFMRLLPVLLLSLSAVIWADTLPRIEGENVLGKKVVLPDAASGHPAILIAGFSHASEGQVKAWAARLDREFPDQAAVTVYPMAVLEAVPRLVRGMASHGIKSGTPKEQRDRFLLIYHKEAELKTTAEFSAPDDAYVLLIDGSGVIQWRFHGPVSDAAVMQLQTEVHSVK